MNNYTQEFCRIVKKRSDEHRRAITILINEGIYSQVLSILRQELDSLIRIIYLLSINDLTYRIKLIDDLLNGKLWKDKSGKRITDKVMVDLATNLYGWTKNVYRFGCAFIHLSNFHDYETRDPLNIISDEDRQVITQYMSYYHGVHFSANLTFNDLCPHFKEVFNKISSNLECYLSDLVDNKYLNDES